MRTFVIIPFTAAILAAVGLASAATWTVDPGGGGDFETIQPAIDFAAPGDTVLVVPGTYTGPENKNLDFGGKAIVVRPNGARNGVVIDCEGDGRGFDFHSGEPSSARVEGLTIINGDVGSSHGGAMRFSLSSSPTISECRMEDNVAGAGGAVSCWESSPRFLDCVIVNNQTLSYGAGGGFSIHRGSTPVLNGCWIEDNSASYSGGMEIYDSAGWVVECTIVNNTCHSMGGGIGCQFASPQIDHCTIVGNASTSWSDSAGGIFLYESDPVIYCSIIAFNEEGAGIWYFQACSYPDIQATDVYGNAEGDWVGCIEGMDGINMNLWVDPCFCDWQNGDYRLEDCSPLVGWCTCEYVGAWGVGCSCTGVSGSRAIETETWGSLKQLYR